MSADDSSMIKEEDLEPPSKVQALSKAEDSYMIEEEVLSIPCKIKDRSKVVEDIPKAEDEQVDSDSEEYSYFEEVDSMGPETHLYWNLEDYPIPDGADLDSVHTNIKVALHNLDIHGCLEIKVYGDDQSHTRFEQYEYNYTFTPAEGGGKSTACQISREILETAYILQPGQPVVVVLSGENTELQRVLGFLHSRYHYVVLRIAPTQPLQDNLFYSFRSVYRCTRFFDGGRTKPPPHPITPKKEQGAKSGVFWDEVDCPFPSNQNFEDIHKKITSALRERNALGDISISVYLDERKRSLIGKRRRDTDPLGTLGMDLYVAEGNKTARLERMLNDVYIWAINNYLSNSHPTDVIVLADGVTDDKEFLKVLEWFGGGGYSVFLITPPKGTESDRSDWPGFLFDCHLHCIPKEV